MFYFFFAFFPILDFLSAWSISLVPETIFVPRCGLPRAHRPPNGCNSTEWTSSRHRDERKRRSLIELILPDCRWWFQHRTSETSWGERKGKCDEKSSNISLQTRMIRRCSFTHNIHISSSIALSCRRSHKFNSIFFIRLIFPKPNVIRSNLGGDKTRLLLALFFSFRCCYSKSYNYQPSWLCWLQQKWNEKKTPINWQYMSSPARLDSRNVFHSFESFFLLFLLSVFVLFNSETSKKLPPSQWRTAAAAQRHINIAEKTMHFGSRKDQRDTDRERTIDKSDSAEWGRRATKLEKILFSIFWCPQFNCCCSWSST